MTIANPIKPFPLIAFIVDEANAAGHSWRFNCGPGAICAVLGMTPSELRPHLGSFEQKGYTNPTLMYWILDNLGVAYGRIGNYEWPMWGLARIQWHGPWMADGVPIRARYRKTHWVSSRFTLKGWEIFDINSMCAGWIPEAEWASQVVPWILRQCVPKADGDWSRTHVLEIER